MGPVLARDGTLFCAIGPLVRAVRPDVGIRWTYVLEAGEQIKVGPAVIEGGLLIMATRAVESDVPGLADLIGRNQKSAPGLYALDTDGHLLWKYAGGSAQASPVIDREGHIFAALADEPYGSPNGRLVRLSSQGQVLQQWSVVTESGSAIAVWEKEEGTWIYYLTTAGALLPGRPPQILYLIRPDAPIRKIVLPVQGLVTWGLTLSQKENALYGLVAREKGPTVLFAMDATTLKMKWRFDLDRGVRAQAPAVASEGIYVGSSDVYQSVPQSQAVTHFHTLYAISHRGKLRWKQTLEGGLDTSPAVDGRGDVYLTFLSEKDDYRYLLCVGPDGAERWRLKIAPHIEPLSPPVIGDEQTVYCYGQRAYAIGNSAPTPENNHEKLALARF